MSLSPLLSGMTAGGGANRFNLPGASSRATTTTTTTTSSASATAYSSSSCSSSSSASALHSDSSSRVRLVRAVHAWTIEDFSLLTRYPKGTCERSGEFDAGGHAWYIELYPSGFGSDPDEQWLTLAVRLKALAPGTTRALAAFTVRLSNQSNAASFDAKSWSYPTLCVFDRVDEGLRFFHGDFIERTKLFQHKIVSPIDDSLLVTVTLEVLDVERDGAAMTTAAATATTAAATNANAPPSVSVARSIVNWNHAMSELIGNPLHSDCKLRIVVAPSPSTTDTAPAATDAAAASSTDVKSALPLASTAAPAPTATADPLIVEIPAHKVILSARSTVFRMMFADSSAAFDLDAAATAVPQLARSRSDISGGGWAESAPNPTIDIPFDRDTVWVLLEFIYSGSLAPAAAYAKRGWHEAVNLLAASELYGLDDLSFACAVYVSRHLTAHTLHDTLRVADRYAATGHSQLRGLVTQFIKTHTPEVMTAALTATTAAPASAPNESSSSQSKENDASSSSSSSSQRRSGAPPHTSPPTTDMPAAAPGLSVAGGRNASVQHILAMAGLNAAAGGVATGANAAAAAASVNLNPLGANPRPVVPTHIKLAQPEPWSQHQLAAMANAKHQHQQQQQRVQRIQQQKSSATAPAKSSN